MDEDIAEQDAHFVDVEGLDADVFEWGARKTLINGALMPGAEQTIALVWVMPGEEDPLHTHPNGEMVAYVLNGECEFRIGDTMYHLVAGDTVRVPRGVEHNAACTGWEPLKLFVAQSAPRLETVMVEE